MIDDSTLDPTELGAPRAGRPSPAADDAKIAKLGAGLKAVLAAAIAAEPFLSDHEQPPLARLRDAVRRHNAIAQSLGIDTDIRRAFE